MSVMLTRLQWNLALLSDSQANKGIHHVTYW
jgi:hypothetical protein